MGSTSNGAANAGGRASGDILVVGGYGDVGSSVSEHLARRFPGRVVIGGRRGAAAEALADRIGHKTRAVQMDIKDPADIAAALDGVETLAVCLGDRTGLLLANAVERGLGYVDINAEHWAIEAGRRLHEQARSSGARGVLGIGLAPGVTNLMAASVADRVGTHPSCWLVCC